MKVVLPIIFVLALTACAFAAEEKRADGVTPQPRVRLALTPQGAVAQVEKPAKTEADAVVMDRVVVNESKLPMARRTPQEPEPKKFSLLRGGPMVEGKIGSLPFAAGLWAWDDLFKEDAKFRPQKTRVDVDFLRIKW